MLIKKRNTNNRFINTVLSIILFYIPLPSQSGELELNDTTHYYNLFPYFDTIPSHDPLIVTKPPKSKIKKLKFSKKNSSYRLAFKVHNKTENTSWVLHLDNKHLNQIKLFRKTIQGFQLQGKSGRLSSHTQTNSTYLPAFFINLNQYEIAEFELSIAFDDTQNTVLPNEVLIQLSSLNNFLILDRWSYSLRIFFLGTLLLFFCFYLLLYFKANLPSYGYFLVYLLSQFGLNFYYDGFNYQFSTITNDPLTIEIIIRVFTSLCYVAFLLYLRHMLPMIKNIPILNNTSKIIIILFLLFIPLSVFHSKIIAVIQDIAGILTSPLTIVLALYLFFRGYKVGLYLTLSLFPLMFATIVVNIIFYNSINIVVFGAIPIEDIIYQTGVILQIILLSLLLAHTFNSTHRKYKLVQSQTSKQLCYIIELKKLHLKKYKKIMEFNKQNTMMQNNVSENLKLNMRKTPDFLQRAKVIIKNNLSNSHFDVKALASAMFVSEPTLRRRLENFTGYTPAKFIRLHRLQAAKTLLSTGDYQTLSQVAFAVGFKQSGYFSRLYRKTFNTPPTIKKTI